VDLFAAAPAIESIADSAVEAWAKALNPDELSPREALEALYQLKKLSDLT
jgi:DNA mismatch repair protein MutS